MVNDAEDGNGEQRVRICPNCGSDAVEPEYYGGFQHTLGSTNKWHCNHCGFVAVLFPEVPRSEVPDDPVAETIPEPGDDANTLAAEDRHRADSSRDWIVLLVMGFLILVLFTSGNIRL